MNRKKIIIILFVIVSLIALIPIVGNSLVKDALDKKLDNLESQGINILKNEEDISYLETSRHYEFVVSDTQKFLEYLQKYSREQLPPYTNALVGGTIVGMDLQYSNIPFSKAVSVDIYPLSLSDEVMIELKENDEKFAEYIKYFLFKKGLLYHIDYNIVTQYFDGYIKDVHENYTLENNAKVIVEIINTKFKGNGDLIAPASLQAQTDSIVIKFTNPNEEMSINLQNFSSTSNFENQGTYLLSAALDSLQINLKAPASKKETINISKLYINASSNTQGEKAELNTKVSFDTMQVRLKNLDLNTSNINYDVAISQIDKTSLQKLRHLASKAKSSNNTDIKRQLKQTMIQLLSKGVKLDIVDLSIENINLNNKDLDGFKIKTEIILKEDSALAGKMMFSPLLILTNVNFDFKSVSSKKIINEISASLPIPISLVDYAKTKGDDVIFDATYKQNSLKINGKSLL